MEKLKIDENGSYESDKWYYNPEKADIKEIKKETLNKVMPEYDFYSVYLEGYYGWHKKHSRCLVLLNSDSGKLVIIDPIWYDEISPVLIKMIIGYEFENKKELQLFTFELQEVLLTGSINLDFNNTIFTENNITFNLIETHKEEGNVWRKIEIGINKNTIESLTSTNPITEEKRIINK
ncbi:hypothetical protein HNV10_17005 [Winogradskyella litoriviva]|uniref:Uncharacterized protein n=1 Tax=Winogradskyella litoriviva TaxID=1220182 RepID=A0ABX2EBP7_9FLAO|nr:hypothetical protein [Winogradskyella litoriviva]NRD24952.1 hypothetical protein [Winogradskyella litoriviva]